MASDTRARATLGEALMVLGQLPGPVDDGIRVKIDSVRVVTLSGDRARILLAHPLPFAVALPRGTRLCLDIDGRGWIFREESIDQAAIGEMRAHAIA